MQSGYRARGAARHAGMVLGMDPDDIDWDRQEPLADLGLPLQEDHGREAELRDLAERVEGSRQLDLLTRHVSMHPCGVILSDTSLLDRTPVQPSGMGTLISAVSGGTVVELVTKAFLATTIPGESRQIQLQLSSCQGKWRTCSSDVLATARSMIKAKTSAAPWTTQDQELVLEARNSIAHLGLLRKDGADFMKAGRKIIDA